MFWSGLHIEKSSEKPAGGSVRGNELVRGAMFIPRYCPSYRYVHDPALQNVFSSVSLSSVSV